MDNWLLFIPSKMGKEKDSFWACSHALSFYYKVYVYNEL